MELIYELGVKDLLGTVAVDAQGTLAHTTGPREWQSRVDKAPVAVA